MKQKLVIIDDDHVVCALLIRHLGQEYEAAGFSDIEEALRHLKRNGADVVVTHFNMPKIDGLEVLKRVKTDSPRTDVILMTSYAALDKAITAITSGAYDYIIQPFTADELSLKLKNLFENRKRRDKFELKKVVAEVLAMPDSFNSLQHIEKSLIAETLRKAEGNMTRTSKLLNVSYETLRYRMKKFGISRTTYKTQALIEKNPGTLDEEITRL